MRAAAEVEEGAILVGADDLVGREVLDRLNIGLIGKDRKCLVA